MGDDIDNENIKPSCKCLEEKTKILTFKWNPQKPKSIDPLDPMDSHQSVKKDPLQIVQIGTFVYMENDFLKLYVKVTSFGGGEYGNEINGIISGFCTSIRKEKQPDSKCFWCAHGIPYRLGSIVQFYEGDYCTDLK